MAVSVQDLIKQKDKILAKKDEQFDLKTSIGTITVLKPSRALVTETLDLSDGNDAYLIVNATVSPNLKDKDLQTAYGCTEPTDIVYKLFDPGVVPAISRAIMKCAGYNVDIESKLHEDVKN